MTERQMLYGLSRLSFLTANKFERLLGTEGSIEGVFNIEEKRLRQFGFSEKEIGAWGELRHRQGQLSTTYHREAGQGIRFISRVDKDFPEKLKPYPGQPIGLYVRGRLPDPDRPAVAVVGARNCSSYGKQLAAQFGRELAEAGVQVISGVAAGIDGISQMAALEAGGESFGILGCGIDVIYPPENEAIYTKLVKNGGLISEYAPGRPPLSYQFPPRNRIISGLCDCLVVVEARKKSGTLITTDFALEQGKYIGAVPGRVGDRLSEGCNQLIQTGAFLIQNTEEILNILGIYSKTNEKNVKNPEKRLASLEKTVYSCLGLLPKHLEQIVEETLLSLPQVTEILLTLELDGLVSRVGVNEYVKKLG